MLLSGSPAAASALDQSFLQALPGFIVVLTRDGKLLYVSENVQEYLGLSMVRHLCSFLFHTHLYFLRFTGETGYYNEYFWLSVIHSLDTQVCLGKTGGVCVRVKLTVLFTNKSNALSPNPPDTTIPNALEFKIIRQH